MTDKQHNSSFLQMVMFRNPGEFWLIFPKSRDGISMVRCIRIMVKLFLLGSWPNLSASLHLPSDILDSSFLASHLSQLFSSATSWIYHFICWFLFHYHAVKWHLAFINLLFTSLACCTRLSSATSLLSHSLFQSVCLTTLFPGSTTNVWPSCSQLYYSTPCVSRYHQTCMPDMMYWLCLIIEMLNKYLQMADSSSPGQAHKCDLWSVSYCEGKTAVIVSVWKLDFLRYMHVFRSGPPVLTRQT